MDVYIKLAKIVIKIYRHKFYFFCFRLCEEKSNKINTLNHVKYYM